jgi:hypothetical protein
MRAMPLRGRRDALLSTLAATVGVCLLVLNLGGPARFLDLVWRFKWHIIMISGIAGAVRLFFKREGVIFSLICGALVALVGFFAILLYVASHI